MPTAKKSYSTEIALLSKLRNHFKDLGKEALNLKQKPIKNERISEPIRLFKEVCDYTKEKDVLTFQTIINLLLSNIEIQIRKNFEQKRLPVFDKDVNNLKNDLNLQLCKKQLKASLNTLNQLISESIEPRILSNLEKLNDQIFDCFKTLSNMDKEESDLLKFEFHSPSKTSNKLSDFAKSFDSKSLKKKLEFNQTTESYQFGMKERSSSKRNRASEDESKILKEDLSSLRCEYGKITHTLLKSIKDREVQEKTLLSDYSELKKINEILRMDLEGKDKNYLKKIYDLEKEIKSKNEIIDQLREENECLRKDAQISILQSKKGEEGDIDSLREIFWKKHIDFIAEKEEEKSNTLHLLTSLVILFTKYKAKELSEQHEIIIEKYVKEANRELYSKISDNMNFLKDKNIYWLNELKNVLQETLIFFEDFKGILQFVKTENLDEKGKIYYNSLNERFMYSSKQFLYKEKLNIVQLEISNFENDKVNLVEITKSEMPDSKKQTKNNINENYNDRNRNNISDSAVVLFSNESFGQPVKGGNSDFSNDVLKMMLLQAVSIEKLLQNLEAD